MRRKSNRNAQKATPEKSVKEKETTPKTRRSRRRKRSPSKSSESEGEVLTVTKRTPLEETPDTTTKSHTPSDEETSEEPMWKVTSTEESPPKGEIQKLKICLTRPSPDSPDKSKTRRSKSNSQTEDDTTSSEDKSTRRTRSRGSPFVRNDRISSQEGDEDVEEKKGKGKSKGKHKSKLEKSPHLSEPELQTNNEISENVQVTPQSPSIDKPVDNENDCKVDVDDLQNVNENVQSCENINEEAIPNVRDSDKDQDAINTGKHEPEPEEVTQSKDSDDDQPLSIIQKSENDNKKVKDAEIETSNSQDEVASNENELITKENEDTEVIKENEAKDVAKENEDKEVIKENEDKAVTKESEDKVVPKENEDEVISKEMEDEIVSKEKEGEAISKEIQDEAVPKENQDESVLPESQEEVSAKDQQNLEESHEEASKENDIKDVHSEDLEEEVQLKDEKEVTELIIEPLEKKTDDKEAKDQILDESNTESNTSKEIPELPPIKDVIIKEQTLTENAEKNKSKTSDAKINTSKASEKNSSPKVAVSEKRRESPRGVRERAPRRRLKRNLSIQPESKEEGDSNEISSIKPSRIKRKWGGDAKPTSSLIKLDLYSIQSVWPSIDFPEEPDLTLEVEKERRRSLTESTTKKLERKVSVEYKSDHSERPSFEKQTSVSSVTKDSEEDNSNIIAFNRKISIVDDTASKLKPPPSPAKNAISNILYITNLVRPFTVKQLKELLQRTGKIQEEGFWTDRIKSKCYVKYETQEEAEATRNALHGVQWPIGNGKKLIIDYATEEDMQNAKNPPAPPPAAAPVPEPKAAAKENLEPVENKPRAEEKISKELEKKKPEGPVREWDIGKKDVRRDRSRSREKNRKHRRTPTPSEDFISRKQRKTEESVPQKLMDDLFLKTKATPSIYWQPLSPEEISMKQQQRLIRMEEHKRRMEENSRMKSRDMGRGAFRRRYD